MAYTYLSTAMICIIGGHDSLHCRKIPRVFGEAETVLTLSINVFLRRWWDDRNLVRRDAEHITGLELMEMEKALGESSVLQIGSIGNLVAIASLGPGIFGEKV